MIHIFSPLSEPAAVGLLRRARLGRQRVGPRAGFAQRVGADDLAGDAAAAGTSLSAPAVPKSTSGRMLRLAWPPNVVANDADARDALDDDERRRLVEIEAAVLLGHVDAEQPELAASADQRARQLPVLRLRGARALGSTSLLDELLVVCAISRCSSESFSGVKTRPAVVSSSSHEPPLMGRESCADLQRCVEVTVK